MRASSGRAADTGLIATALVLVAVCVLVAGVLVAGTARSARPACAQACACAGSAPAP